MAHEVDAAESAMVTGSAEGIALVKVLLVVLVVDVVLEVPVPVVVVVMVVLTVHRLHARSH